MMTTVGIYVEIRIAIPAYHSSHSTILHPPHHPIPSAILTIATPGHSPLEFHGFAAMEFHRRTSKRLIIGRHQRTAALEKGQMDEGRMYQLRYRGWLHYKVDIKSTSSRIAFPNVKHS